MFYTLFVIIWLWRGFQERFIGQRTSRCAFWRESDIHLRCWPKHLSKISWRSFWSSGKLLIGGKGNDFVYTVIKRLAVTNCLATEAENCLQPMTLEKEKSSTQLLAQKWPLSTSKFTKLQLIPLLTLTTSRPSETYSMKFAGFSSSYEECRAECVGLYLSDYDDMVSIFGYHGLTPCVVAVCLYSLILWNLTGAEAEDLKYVNWLNMVRAGLVALEFYNPETRKHGQAHMQVCYSWLPDISFWLLFILNHQARYVILRVLLEASKGNDFVKLDRDAQGDLFISVDRKQVKTVGMKVLFAAFLLVCSTCFY